MYLCDILIPMQVIILKYKLIIYLSKEKITTRKRILQWKCQRDTKMEKSLICCNNSANNSRNEHCNLLFLHSVFLSLCLEYASCTESCLQIKA